MATTAIRPDPSVHRPLIVVDPPMLGRDVGNLQRAVHARRVDKQGPLRVPEGARDAASRGRLGRREVHRQADAPGGHAARSPAAP